MVDSADLRRCIQPIAKPNTAKTTATMPVTIQTIIVPIVYLLFNLHEFKVFVSSGVVFLKAGNLRIILLKAH